LPSTRRPPYPSSRAQNWGRTKGSNWSARQVYLLTSSRTTTQAVTEPERMEEEVVGEVAMLVVALTTFANDLVAGGNSWWRLLVELAGGICWWLWQHLLVTASCSCSNKSDKGIGHLLCKSLWWPLCDMAAILCLLMGCGDWDRVLDFKPISPLRFKFILLCPKLFDEL